MNDGKQTGTVKWFDILKGYGFIVPDEQSDPDRFVHISAWQETVKPEEGQRVAFDVKPGLKGPEARDVKLVHEDEPAT